MVEQAKARELLAAAYDSAGRRDTAFAIRTAPSIASDHDYAIALNAITTALEAGRAEERERVVAHVKAWSHNELFQILAKTIEDGEHVANERPDGC